MLPATKAVPKEMLTIVDTPVIELVVREALSAGCDRIVIITSSQKSAIEAHFSPQKELEELLRKKGRQEDLDRLEDWGKSARFTFVRQQEQKGLGHAVFCAKEAVRDETFAVLLGDTVMDAEPTVLQQLMKVYRERNAAVIAVDEVERELVSRYGIIEGNEIEPGLWQATKMIEKPRPDETTSRLAVAARYILPPEIFDYLSQTTPGTGGEIQLTDALNCLCSSGTAYALRMKGERFDIGNPLDFVRCNLHFAGKLPDFLA
jgi:UTP--glucose-1-phosphate uridylyltransferase